MMGSRQSLEPREVQVFDEFLEIIERPTTTHPKPHRVHVSELPSSDIIAETTHTYRALSGVKVAVTCPEREGESVKEIRAALEEAVGEFESEMEAKERACT